MNLDGMPVRNALERQEMLAYLKAGLALAELRDDEER